MRVERRFYVVKVHRNSTREWVRGIKDDYEHARIKEYRFGWRRAHGLITAMEFHPRRFWMRSIITVKEKPYG